MKSLPYLLVEQVDCWQILRFGHFQKPIVAELLNIEPDFAQHIVDALNALDGEYISGATD